MAVAKHGVILSHVFNIKHLKLNKSILKSEIEILLRTPTLTLWNLPSQQGGYWFIVSLLSVSVKTSEKRMAQENLNTIGNIQAIFMVLGVKNMPL